MGKARGVLLALLFATLGCGSDKGHKARPCSDCDEIQAQIAQAAEQDGLASTEGVCVMYPVIPGRPERTVQYQEACEAYAECISECK